MPIRSRIKQGTQYDCSAACIGMLAEHFTQIDVDDFLDGLPYMIGEPMAPEGRHYAPTAEEIRCLLARKYGIEMNSYTTDAYYRDIIGPPEHAEWHFDKRSFFSSKEVLRRCRGKIALLFVRSNIASGGHHLVIWNGEQILDPSPSVGDGDVYPDWAEYTVLEVLIILE